MCTNIDDENEITGLASLSESRLDSLKYFASNTESETVILLLRESSANVLQLQTAYAICEPNEVQKLVNRCYDVPLGQGDLSDFHEKISNDIREILAIETAPFFAELNYRTQSQPYEIKNTGLVIYFTEQHDEVAITAKIASKLLCKELELSRSLRISETIRECQKVAQEEWREQYDTLTEICKIVRSSLDCDGAATYGFSREQKWKNLNREKEHDDIDVSELDFSIDHSRRVQVKGDVDNEFDALLVPIHRPYIALVQQKFKSISTFLRELEPELQAHQAVLYYNKTSSLYLQSKFSSTDQIVCDRVFYSIQAFLAAKDYQEGYSSTLEALTAIDPKSFPSHKKLRKILRGISLHFVNIGVINVEREAETFKIAVDRNYSTSVFSKEYIDRLKENYLQTFFEKYGDNSPDEIYVGIDQAKDSFRLEIHFSSHHNDTKIFVVECSESHVTEAAIRSVVHLFSELHLRYKREATLVERADYITQVRHVVVHHISSTLDNLTSIQATWRAAEKNEQLWASMRRDVDFPRFLDQGIGNLARATQILELGRFIIDEIDPASLNKKPFDPITAINEIFALLAYTMKKKRLVPKSIVTGSRPSIINGDEELLRIAYLNLVDNAVKYSAVGRQIDWKIAYHEDHYVFEIKSIGNPILELEKEKLLHTRLRARQLDNLNQRHGTGWGLPVTAKILRAHSSRAQLDFKTIIDADEPINSQNIFFFEMPYKTGIT